MRDRRIKDRRLQPGDAELGAEVESSLQQLDDRRLRRVLESFRAEYSAFAHRNASRLNVINQTYHTLARRIMVVLGVLFVVLILLGLWGVHLQAQNSDTLDQVQAGRHTSLAVSCAIQSAIAETGRSVIAGPPKSPPPRQERALEHLGFPPFKVRHAQAEKQADAYVAAISRRIDQKIGRRGDGLVQHGGTINCARLAQLAKLSH